VAPSRRDSPARSRRLLVALAVLLVVVAGACTGQDDAGPVPATTTSVNPGWRGTDLLWDVASGPAGFVAVGDAGVIVASGDGIAWNRVRTPSQPGAGVNGSPTSWYWGHDPQLGPTPPQARRRS
jgi:hypothetical protein